MRKLFFAILILYSLNTIAQDSAKVSNDTISFSASDSLDKLNKDSIFKETLERNSKNLDSFLQYQKEQKEKEQRRAMLRIGLGIFFLIVLIIGLSRRNKKKNVS